MRRLQPVHVWWLVLLLLAAQALGLAHRVAHAPGLPGGALAHVAAAAHASHEAGSAECRLVDQLAHADALCGSMVLPPAPLRTADTGHAVARPALTVGSAAAYLARGPPASA